MGAEYTGPTHPVLMGLHCSLLRLISPMLTWLPVRPTKIRLGRWTEQPCWNPLPGGFGRGLE